jgi:hypothetical protein
MNHKLHIAAATQARLDTKGRGYYRRKLAEGKARMEACGAQETDLRRRLPTAPLPGPATRRYNRSPTTKGHGRATLRTAG